MTFRGLSLRPFLLAGTASAIAGCAGPEGYYQSFDRGSLPPILATRQPPTKPTEGDGVKPARTELPAADPVLATPSPGEPTPPVTDGRCAPGPLALPDAIALAFRMQPRLRVFLAGVVQAGGAEPVADAPCLPSAPELKGAAYDAQRSR